MFLEASVLDLNCDLGEGFGQWRMGDDDALLKVVTSANIACGFHAGDPTIMRRTCERAVAEGVRIGAHVGHRDLAGFGRRYIAICPSELEDETLYQIGALEGAARAAGDRVRYVKPHGALYHSVSADAGLASAVVSAMRTFDPDLVLLGPAGTALEQAAQNHGIAFFAEGFADRAYTASGALAARAVPGAVLDHTAAVAQALSLATDGTAAVAGDAGRVAVHPRSICVHGDSPDAVAVARTIRTELDNAGVEMGAFT